jgi:hypothetical protein
MTLRTFNLLMSAVLLGVFTNCAFADRITDWDKGRRCDVYASLAVNGAKGAMDGRSLTFHYVPPNEFAAMMEAAQHGQAPKDGFWFADDALVETEKRWLEDAIADGWMEMTARKEGKAPLFTSADEAYGYFREECQKLVDVSELKPVQTQSQSGLKHPDCAAKAASTYELCLSTK